MKERITPAKFLKIHNLAGNKYYRKNIDYKAFKKKIYEEKNYNINNLTSLKYVNWLFTR